LLEEKDMSLEQGLYLDEHFKAEANKSFQVKAKKDKYRVLWKFLQVNRKEANVLDIGSGKGFDLIALGDCKFSIGLDVISEYLRQLTGFNRIRATGELLPFKDNFFHIVDADNVLEHIKHDEKAVSEIYRVLDKNGIAIINVPAHRLLWSKADIVVGHYRRYSAKEMKKLFSKFEIVSFNHRNFVLSFIQIVLEILHLYTLRNDEGAMGAVSPFLLKFLNMEQRFPLPFGTSFVLICRKA